MQRTARLAAFIALALLSGCGALSADPVFVGARVEPAECSDGQFGCVRVFSEVDGSREGAGSCMLYARTGPGGARVAVAASGELDLVPGSVVEWIVRTPSHLGDWDPTCVPTAEG